MNQYFVFNKVCIFPKNNYLTFVTICSTVTMCKHVSPIFNQWAGRDGARTPLDKHAGTIFKLMGHKMVLH